MSSFFPPLFFLISCGAVGQSQTVSASSAVAREFNAPRELKIVPPVDGLRSIRLVSWNIDRGSRLDTVSSELERNPTDLYMLQEVDWNANRSGNIDVAAELAKRLQLNLAYGVEFEELGQERGQPALIGQATLTRLPILSSRILRFQTQSGWWKPHDWMPSSMSLMQRRMGNRIALVTEVEFAGHLLVIYNTHLESRSFGKIQSRQLEEILADLQRYPLDTPIILGGDLNTKYFPSKYVRRLKSQGFESATGERIERTHTIAMALDWIFAKGSVKVESGIVRRDFKGSDHYPIFAELRSQ